MVVIWIDAESLTYPERNLMAVLSSLNIILQANISVVTVCCPGLNPWNIHACILNICLASADSDTLFFHICIMWIAEQNTWSLWCVVSKVDYCIFQRFNQNTGKCKCWAMKYFFKYWNWGPRLRLVSEGPWIIIKQWVATFCLATTYLSSILKKGPWTNFKPCITH